MRPIAFYATVAALVACDQVSKAAVTRAVREAGRPILEPFFSLTPVQNTGGAFSLLQAHNQVFITIAVVAVAALVYSYHTISRRDLMLSAALALTLGGAIGNLMDRAQFGFVRDFFHLHTPTGQTLWPIFNIADSAITVAIVILVVRAIRPGRRADHTSEPAVAPRPDEAP
jgi:signal peptidase II